MANLTINIDGDTGALEEKLERLSALGDGVFERLAEGVAAFAQQSVAAAAEFDAAFGEVLAAVRTAAEVGWQQAGLAQLGGDAVTGMAAAVDENTALAEAMRRQVEGAVGAAVNEALLQAQGLSDIGRQLVAGIAAGITANARLAADAMAQVIVRAEAAARQAGKINSPSRLMREEVGAWLPAGVAEGIKDGTTAVADAAAAQAQAVLDAYGGLGPGVGAPGLAGAMRGIFNDVPREFFALGEAAAGQFAAGFGGAATAYFALFENLMAGEVPMAATVSARGESAARPIEIHFHDEVQAPDAVTRAVRNVFEYGLAGERN